jgi:DNA repair exonuclease SbcCD nuclease subunit
VWPNLFSSVRLNVKFYLLQVGTDVAKEFLKDFKEAVAEEKDSDKIWLKLQQMKNSLEQRLTAV